MNKAVKRSKKAALVLMVPATGFFLASCSTEEPVPSAVYKNAEECKNSKEKNPIVFGNITKMT